MMKLMDKHKNIINLLGVCTQDGEGLRGQGSGTGLEQAMGLLGTVTAGRWGGTGQGRAEWSGCPSQGHCT